MEKRLGERKRNGVRKKEGEIWWGGVEGGAVGRATQTNEENEEFELSNTIHLLFVTSGRCTCELQDYFCKSTAHQASSCLREESSLIKTLQNRPGGWNSGV